MSTLAIEVTGLTKSYGSVEAVRGIDVHVREGSVFALLGPNGAGKTTTVEILEGFRERSGGDVRVLGEDPAQRSRSLREQVGIVLQTTGLDPYLTVEETFEQYRGYFPAPRPLDEIVELVGLADKRSEKVTRLSGGQQRRVDVGVALAGDPKLLFLDEPTTGFDPNARRAAWDVVRNLAGLGKTVFLTTHYMDEAQFLADEVAVIAGGRIVAQGPPDTIGGRDTATAVVRFRVPEAPALPASIADRVELDGGIASFRAVDPSPFLYDLTGWSTQHNATLDGLEVHRPTLEEIYLELTKDESGMGGSG